MKRRCRRLTFAVLFAVVMRPAFAISAEQGFSPRPSAPRVTPVPAGHRDEAQRRMLAARPDFNIYTTLAHHPALYSNWSGLGAFLLNASSLPARDRELLMLRVGWLCQAEYEWAQHARIATASAGVTEEEIRRIAEGPDADGWSESDRNLLRMVDELRFRGAVGGETRAALGGRFTDLQMMEALFTVAQYQLVSMALNTLGIQLDEGLRHRLPRDLPMPPTADPVTGIPGASLPIVPIAPDEWTPEALWRAEPRVGPDGAIPGLYAVLGRHPKLCRAVGAFESYLESGTSLPPRTRELIALRTAVLLGSEDLRSRRLAPARAAGLTAEEIDRIADGSGAGGWNDEDRAVLRAAEQLRREAFIDDEVWSALARRLDTRQLIELVFTAGGATMVSLAANSFGIRPSGNEDAHAARQERGADTRAGWTTWGGDPGFTRYSPLDQIDRDNVGTLELAWRWAALPQGAAPDFNLKATPLMVNGTLYIATGVHQVAAVDPGTGATIWIHTPAPPDLGGRGLAVSSRGLAWWSDGDSKRIFHNTLDGRLLSIDADTGAADTAFGREGMVHLKEGLADDDRPVPYVGSSSPPTVVGDVVIAQVIGEITPPNTSSFPCDVRGFDVRTGRRLWTFHTIPREGEFGNETWEADSWKYTGNTGVWSMMSADPDLGYVYLPVETPTHDFYGGHRPGDNLFGESLVCLDARTGRRVWHFQIVHHGLWDYDPPAAPILHDVKVGGRTVRAVTQLTKQGMSFVFDRVTGDPVWPITERPVPRIDVPGERHSPTQPFPEKPPPYGRLGYSEEDLLDFTPELKAEAVAIAEDYVRGPIYTPPTPAVDGGTQGTWVYPGYGGGSNWNGGAFDPETGLMFVPTRNLPMNAALAPADPAKTDWNFVRAPTEFIRGPRGLPVNRPPWTLITATDMNRGVHVWSRAIGGAPASVREHPDLAGLGLDFDRMGQPNVRPSPLVTRTLLFLAEAGNLSGDPGGPMFRAYDKLTGRVLAEIELPSKATGAPMTYLHEGRQYIAIAVATRQHPAEIVALALPGGASPARNLSSPRERARSAGSGHAALTPEESAGGRRLYATYCAACHGAAGEGVPGSTSPLTGLTDLDSIRRVTAEGSIKMPPMKTLLTPSEIDLVSRYVAGGNRPDAP